MENQEESTSKPAKFPNTFKDPLGECLYQGNCACSYSMEPKLVVVKKQRKRVGSKGNKQVCKKMTEKCDEILRKRNKCSDDNSSSKFPSFETYKKNLCARK